MSTNITVYNVPNAITATPLTSGYVSAALVGPYPSAQQTGNYSTFNGTNPAVASEASLSVTGNLVVGGTITGAVISPAQVAIGAQAAAALQTYSSLPPSAQTQQMLTYVNLMHATINSIQTDTTSSALSTDFATLATQTTALVALLASATTSYYTHVSTLR